MEKSFKYLWINFTEAQAQYESYKKYVYKLIQVLPEERHKLELLKNKLEYHKKILREFGKGLVVEITGKYYEKPKLDNVFNKYEDFSLLLVNTELDEAKKYFKVFSENSEFIFDNTTISFKELPTREIINIKQLK